MSETNNTLEFYKSEYEKLQKQQGVCPSCGHCPQCGRGGHQVYPWGVTPQYPTYPQPWYPTWITVTSANQC